MKFCVINQETYTKEGTGKQPGSEERIKIVQQEYQVIRTAWVVRQYM
jgi:hypothetical protein